jgi:uncharacterized protein
MGRFLARLAALQVVRPWTFLIIGAATVVMAGLLAARLELHTSFGDLLPSNKESVIVAEDVNKRLPSLSTVVVVAEGSDNAGLERFVDALAVELRKLPPEQAGQVDVGVRHTQEFFEKNKLLYAPRDLLEEIHHQIRERYEWEVAKRAGTLVDDYEPPPINEESIRRRIEERNPAAAALPADGPQFPDGYYMDAQKHQIALRLLTPLGVGDKEVGPLLDGINAAIDGLDPKSFDPEIRVGLAGNLLIGMETYDQIKGDLTHVGAWGLGLILGVVVLFYMRVRIVLCMVLSVMVGTVWTFGFAYAAIGYLNTSTGFLFSIIVGNGINFGIIYMARYLEARRTVDVAESVRLAHQQTWAATFTAAAAASAAYGSLVVTNFRGFKHFGIIGGSGMLLCWAATFLFLPPLLIASEKLWPIGAQTGIVARLSGIYSSPFARLVDRLPRVVVAASLLLTTAAGYLVYRYVAADPMEYYMGNIDNEEVEEKPTDVVIRNRIAGRIVGRAGQDGLAIAVDRVDQVLPLKEALDAKNAAGPKPAFDSVVTIFSLLPSDQEKKIALMKDARSLVERAHGKGFVAEEDWKKLDELIPASGLRPIGIADLPQQVAEPFTEVDGTRGRLVYIVPRTDESVWNGHYLIRWADSFRSTTLPDGSVVKGSGRSVIYADMLLAIVEDAPRAITVSLILTLLIVVLAFRGRSAGLWVLGSVFMGLCWMVAILAIWKSKWPWEEGGVFALEGLKLNFLNFVALPITLGVGADYAVNVMKRYEIDGAADIRRVVAETGGAVMLCSLTTMLGYFALTLSVNLAIRSFGIAAAAGEICCLLTGIVVLPACLTAIARARRRKTVSEPATAE